MAPDPRTVGTQKPVIEKEEPRPTAVTACALSTPASTAQQQQLRLSAPVAATKNLEETASSSVVAHVLVVPTADVGNTVVLRAPMQESDEVPNPDEAGFLDGGELTQPDVASSAGGSSETGVHYSGGAEVVSDNRDQAEQPEAAGEQQQLEEEEEDNDDDGHDEKEEANDPVNGTRLVRDACN